MPEAPTGEDDARLFAVFDQYVTALQAGDMRECERLLEATPDLRGLARAFAELDGFLPRPAGASVGDRAAFDRSAEETLPAPGRTAPGRPIAEVPQDLGAYELLEDVLRSNWSTTWRAKITATGRATALTFLAPRRRLSGEVVARLQQAGSLRAARADGGLVRVLGSGMANGLQFLVLDRCVGRPLGERVQGAALETHQAARIVGSVARDVEGLLSAGLALETLDPDQILIDEGGRVFLTDYWCTLSDRPEPTAGSQPTLRALGTLLADLLKLPARFGSSAGDSADRSVDLDASQLPLAAVCRQCTRPTGQRRYAAVGDLAADLERYLRGEPILAPPPTWGERWAWWFLEEPTLGPRLITVLTAATIVEVSHLLAHQPWLYHPEIKLVLVVWCLASFLFRWLSVRLPTRTWGRTSWVLSDSIFASTCLLLVPPEIGTLLVVYPLMQTITSLWRRRRLVLVSTGANLVSYGVVLWYRGEAIPQPHYPVLAMACIVLMGGFLVLRQGEVE